MTYILVIIAGIVHPSIDHLEFYSKADCEAARDALVKFGDSWSAPHTNAICIAKYPRQ